MNLVSEGVIGACIEVHRHLGPGLLENAYEEPLAYELGLRGLAFVRQAELDVSYKGQRFAVAYRMDLLVEGCVVVELKSVEQLLAIHEAQLLTYLRLGGFPVGLLVNFGAPLLRKGLRRIANKAPELPNGLRGQ